MSARLRCLAQLEAVLKHVQRRCARSAGSTTYREHSRARGHRCTRRRRSLALHPPSLDTTLTRLWRRQVRHLALRSRDRAASST